MRGVRFKRYPKYKNAAVEWFGQIPAHWDIQRLKTIAVVHLSNVDKKSVEGEERVELCNYVDVYYNEHISSELSFMAATATREQVRRFALRTGDVLITKDSESWTDIAVPAVVVEDLPEVLCGYHLAHIRPGPGIDGRFLGRAFAAIGPRDQFRVAANGITRFGLGGDAIATGLFAVPSVGEQKVIAGFLDRKVEKIDALLAKKARLIQLLQEQRVAIVTRVVTQGLEASCTMKESGAELPEQIPAHWDIKPFTKYVVDKSDYRGRTPEKTESGVFLVTARNVRMGKIDYEDSREFISEEDYEEVMSRGKPRLGDILFTTEAPLGNVALVDREDIALAQRIIRFRMNPKWFSDRFTLYAMMSEYFQTQLRMLSTGSTAEGLKASKLTQLWLVWPPLAEQEAIAAHLDRHLLALDTLVTRVGDAVRRLNEFRTALISAAVTGKIDVRDLPDSSITV